MVKVKNKENRKGFTLLELLLAVFIFSLVMITVVALFVRFVTFQQRATAIQQNMEDARYAMELMAKTMRTSSLVGCENFTSAACNPSGGVQSIEIFDYSQSKCIRYYFAGGRIKSSLASVADKAGCVSAAIPVVGTDMADKYIKNMAFWAIETGTATPTPQVGKIRVSMEVCSTIGCTGAENDTAALQTTVSLRDYKESNP